MVRLFCIGKLACALYSLTLLLVFNSLSCESMGVKINADLNREELLEYQSLLASPLLHCKVCEHAVSEVYTEMERIREATPGKKLEEIAVYDAIDGVCNYKTASGQWVRNLESKKYENGTYDLFPVEGVLFRSNCDATCQAVGTSCARLMEDEFDSEELASFMFNGGHKKLKEAVKKVCTKFTHRCEPKPKSDKNNKKKMKNNKNNKNDGGDSGGSASSKSKKENSDREDL